MKKSRLLAALFASSVTMIAPSVMASESNSVHFNYSEYQLPDTLASDGVIILTEKDFKNKYSKFPATFQKEADVTANDDGIFLFQNDHKNTYVSERTKEYDGQVTDNKEDFLTGTSLKLDNYDGEIGLLTFTKKFQDRERPFDVLVSGNQTVQAPVLHTDDKESIIKVKPSEKKYYVDGNTLYVFEVSK